MILNRVILPPGGHLAKFTDMLSYYSSRRGLLLAFGGQTTLMVLNVLQCTTAPDNKKLFGPK